MQFVPAPLTKLAARRPTCKLIVAFSQGTLCNTLCDWVEYIACFPFKINFQGAWKDHPDSEIDGFMGLYGNLFTTHAGEWGLGYLYGAMQLLQKMILVWFIASTVGYNLEESDQKAQRQAEIQLWALLAVKVVQTVFVLVFRPFNERLENVTQFIVDLTQCGFFLGLALAGLHSEEGTKDVGVLINNLNLIAIVVVMAAAMKAQLFTIRGYLMKNHARAARALKYADRLVHDPMSFFSSEHEAERRPYTDNITFANY